MYPEHYTGTGEGGCQGSVERCTKDSEGVGWSSVRRRPELQRWASAWSFCVLSFTKRRAFPLHDMGGMPMPRSTGGPPVLSATTDRRRATAIVARPADKQPCSVAGRVRNSGQNAPRSGF